MDAKDITKKFDGLLDENVAKEIVDMKLPKINELKEGDIVGLYAKVLSVGKLKNLGKKQVKNAIVGDETGCCILAMWGEIAETELNEGENIKILNARVKNGFYGKELNVGERGEIRKSGKEIKSQCKHFITLRGKIEEERETKIYFINGRERFFKEVRLGTKWIVLIDEKIMEVKEARGNNIEIKWAYEKNGKIYVDDLGKIKIGKKDIRL